MLATPGLKVYITLHSFEQQWLVPWWYTGSRPLDYDELVRNLLSFLCAALRGSCIIARTLVTTRITLRGVWLF